MPRQRRFPDRLRGDLVDRRVLQVQSGLAHGFGDMITSAGHGQPSWLHWL
jgi:hypothetical protein